MPGATRVSIRLRGERERGARSYAAQQSKLTRESCQLGPACAAESKCISNTDRSQSRGAPHSKGRRTQRERGGTLLSHLGALSAVPRPANPGLWRVGRWQEGERAREGGEIRSSQAKQAVEALRRGAFALAARGCALAQLLRLHAKLDLERGLPQHAPCLPALGVIGRYAVA